MDECIQTCGGKYKFFLVWYKPRSTPTTPYLLPTLAPVTFLVFDLVQKCVCCQPVTLLPNLVSIHIHGQKWVAVTTWHYHKTRVEERNERPVPDGPAS